jgi:hypothetical protein
MLVLMESSVFCRPINDIADRGKVEKALFSGMSVQDYQYGEYKILEEVFVRLHKKYIDTNGIVRGFRFEADSAYFGFLVLNYDKNMAVEEIDIYHIFDGRLNYAMVPSFSIRFFSCDDHLIVYEPFFRKLYFFPNDEKIPLKITPIDIDKL